MEQDSAAVLSFGTGTPYVGIFNSYGSPLRDPSNGTPIGEYVTAFDYTYDEENTDKGKMVIETDNPDIVALTELSYQQSIQLQWGWIYSGQAVYCGPVRKVVIISQEVDFGPKGTKITIGFEDAAVFLKNLPSNYVDNLKPFVEYAKDLYKGVPIGVAVIDYHIDRDVSVPMVAQKVNTINGKDLPQDAVTTKPGEGIWPGVYASMGAQRFTIHPGLLPVEQRPLYEGAITGIKLLDYDPKTEKLTIDDPDNFRKVYLKDDLTTFGLVVGTARSKYYQMKDLVKSFSNGPFYVDSRDDYIIIHNSLATRPISKVYTYAGGNGELIEFKVKSSFMKTCTEVKQDTSIDPDSKDVKTTFVQGVTNPNQGNEDGKDIIYTRWLDEAKMRPNHAGSKGDTQPMVCSTFVNRGVKIEVYNDGSQKRYLQGSDGEYHPYNDILSQLPTQTSTEPTTITGKTFSRVSEAQKYLQTHPPQVTQEEIDAYFNKWINDFNSKKGISTEDELKAFSEKLDMIPPFEITRKVTIRVENVNLEAIGGSRGLKNAESLEAQTESFRKALQSGKDVLNNYTSEYYNDEYRGTGNRGMVQNAMIMRGTYIRNAISLIESSGARIIERSITKDGSPSDNKLAEWATIEYETEIKLSLNGVDVAAKAETINIDGSLTNDLIEKITNQVKANAVVIGDPMIETSMNLQIQNVSSKYTGIWYTKKVTHSINSSGYMTNIEFVQRTIPVSTVTIKSQWSKKDYGKELLKAAKASSESKSYQTPSSIEKAVKDARTKAPEKSQVYQTDPRTGKGEIKAYDPQSGLYITPAGGRTDYSNDYDRYYNTLIGGNK